MKNGLNNLKRNKMKINFLWDWLDFGIMFRVFKHHRAGDYYASIDIQFGWLNIWIEIFKKKEE